MTDAVDGDGWRLLAPEEVENVATAAKSEFTRHLAQYGLAVLPPEVADRWWWAAPLLLGREHE